MPSRERYAIGVDIGGTKIAFALVSEQGEVLARHHAPTQARDGFEAVIGRIVQGVNELRPLAPNPILGVGVGCPGFIDAHKGMVIQAVNLYWQNAPLRSALEAGLGDLSVTIENDLRTLALGEQVFGAARGYNDFVHIAMGTGLGVAALVNGQFVRGAAFAAVELGHHPITGNGRACGCGMLGCLETVLSGNGLISMWNAYHSAYHEQSPLARQAVATTHDIITAMHEGDPLAEKMRQEIITWLVQVLAWCNAILNPSLFVMGGGMGRAILPLILDDLQRGFAQTSLLSPPELARIIPSQIEDSAVGAACLAWSRPLPMTP